MNNISSHFSSEDFLGDAEFAIKQKFRTISAFADEVRYHRNTICNVLNHPERLSMYWANLLARKLGMDLHDYIFE
jgi:hypothetical protein